MSQVTVIVCDNANCKFTLGRKRDDEITVKLHNNIIAIVKLYNNILSIKLDNTVYYSAHILTGKSPGGLIKEPVTQLILYCMDGRTPHQISTWLYRLVSQPAVYFKTIPLSELLPKINNI